MVLVYVEKLILGSIVILVEGMDFEVLGLKVVIFVLCLCVVMVGLICVFDCGFEFVFGIYFSVVIDFSVEIFLDVVIGFFVVIGVWVWIGQGVCIVLYVLIGWDMVIGCDVMIYFGVCIVYEVMIGDCVILYFGSLIGVDGFFFVIFELFGVEEICYMLGE